MRRDSTYFIVMFITFMVFVVSILCFPATLCFVFHSRIPMLIYFLYVAGIASAVRFFGKDEEEGYK